MSGTARIQAMAHALRDAYPGDPSIRDERARQVAMILDTREGMEPAEIWQDVSETVACWSCAPATVLNIAAASVIREYIRGAFKSEETFGLASFAAMGAFGVPERLRGLKP